MAEELASSESENITITSHKVALLSDDTVVHNARSIPSTFHKQTVKQIEVIQEEFLSEVSKLNDLCLRGNEQNIRE